MKKGGYKNENILTWISEEQKTPEKMQSINAKVMYILALKTSCWNHLHSLCEEAKRPVLWLEALPQQDFHFVSSCDL